MSLSTYPDGRVFRTPIIRHQQIHCQNGARDPTSRAILCVSQIAPTVHLISVTNPNDVSSPLAGVVADCTPSRHFLYITPRL
jgi:hypothetical protein